MLGEVGSDRGLKSAPLDPTGEYVTLYPVTSLGGPFHMIVICCSETLENCRSVGVGTVSAHRKW